MNYTKAMQLLLGAAAITLVTMPGDRVYAQATDPNAAPNPYRMDSSLNLTHTELVL